MSDQITTTEVRQEGFSWVILGQPPRDRILGARGMVVGGRSQAVATRGGDSRQRPAGVQAAIGAGGMRARDK
jgi:hypothetical protein